MLFKTRGIVLHSIPYSDNYAIVHIYTESFGRASYLVPRNNKGRKRAVSKTLFFPLSVIEMEVEHQSKREIHRIRETKICFLQNEIFCNPLKSMLALFLAEFMYRTIKETESDYKLFDFLYHSIHLLEITEDKIANFHIVFLLRLLSFLGVHPSSESYQANSYFDMQNGIFVNTPPLHRHYLNEAESRVFVRLLRISYENMSLYAFSRRERVLIINRIIEYYRLHLPEFQEIKSISILQSLFDH